MKSKEAVPVITPGELAALEDMANEAADQANGGVISKSVARREIRNLRELVAGEYGTLEIEVKTPEGEAKIIPVRSIGETALSELYYTPEEVEAAMAVNSESWQTEED